jgi:glycosyltransferase involved in cell wall biosynthesis
VIGVVTTSYPRFSGDGAGVFVRERVRALQAEGKTVEVVAAGGGDCRDEEGVARIPGRGLFYAGGAPEALEEAGLLSGLAAWARALGFSAGLLEYLARQGRRWDAVESHWLLPCGIAACIAVPGLPHRAHVHGGDLHLLERLLCGDSVARVFCRSHPDVVFASASLRDRFRALAGASPEDLGARSWIEPAPFDRTIFCRPSEEERRQARCALGSDRPLVLAAGRLVSIKGYDRLLLAVARLPARPVVIIAGEGPDRARLARQARAVGVDLRLPGALDQPALARHMAAATLFVHPCRTLRSGRSEGMPLVVREALARGLPVVASASGGLVELDGADGLVLVPADDTGALAGAIARALGNGG